MATGWLLSLLEYDERTYVAAYISRLDLLRRSPSKAEQLAAELRTSPLPSGQAVAEFMRRTV